MERVFTFEGARGVFRSFAGAKEAAKGKRVRGFQSVIDAEQWLFAVDLARVRRYTPNRGTNKTY